MTTPTPTGPDVLVSIHPRHAARIYSGRKTREFRRVRVRFTVGARVWLYETAPVRRVTGSVVLADVLLGGPELAQLETDPRGRLELEDYLRGAKHVTALIVTGAQRLAEPLTLDVVGVSRAPQSYQFLRD